jgi:hypothetical protein
MRLLLIIVALVVAVLALCFTCSHLGNASNQVPLVNMTNLVAECVKLANDGKAQGKDLWMASDPLPTTIKSLSPQCVQLMTDSTKNVVIDIQLSGGFEHRGYLVVCAKEVPSFIPHKGNNWRITQIAPDVFEYRE